MAVCQVGQQHQDRVASVQRRPGDDGVRRDEAPSVVHGRIEAAHLVDDGAQASVSRSAASQCEQRIADQARGGVVGLK